jgi:hypothetical protein
MAKNQLMAKAKKTMKENSAAENDWQLNAVAKMKAAWRGVKMTVSLDENVESEKEEKEKLWL